MAKLYAIKSSISDSYYFDLCLEPWGAEIDYSNRPETFFKSLEDARNKVAELIKMLGGKYKIVELTEKVVEDDHD